MTKQTLIYRGVKYTKVDGENVTINHDLLDKVYRGIHYFKLPSIKHIACDHVYRGAHYVA